VEVIIQPDREAAAMLVARMIARELGSNPHVVLGLATGKTMERVYRNLVRCTRKNTWTFRYAARLTWMSTLASPPTTSILTGTTWTRTCSRR
jgi:hypothetical protein